MKIYAILATDLNGIIGVNGTFPWHLPDDLKWFKSITMGKPVLMGRKTWDSLPDAHRPLKGRLNLVLTRDPSFDEEGCEVIRNVEDIDEVISALEASGHSEVFVIGGAEVYALFEDVYDGVFATLIMARIKTHRGDDVTQVGNITAMVQGMGIESCVRHPKDARHEMPFLHLTYGYNKEGAGGIDPLELARATLDVIGFGLERPKDHG